MNDVTVTVSGFAGSNAVLNTTREREWTTFRLASTRRYVKENGEWTDGATLWFTVKAWRSAAVNVSRSIRSGLPVVVTGRLELDEWTAPDGQARSGLVIHATSVGVDATRGRVDFVRTIQHDAAPDDYPHDTPAAGGQGSEQGSGQGSGQGTDGGLEPVRPGTDDPFGIGGAEGAVGSGGPGDDPDDQGVSNDVPDDEAAEGTGHRELVTA